MCGIAGFVCSGNRCGREILADMTDALAHRGPDDAGYTCISCGEFSIGLGHRRLSVLDLSSHGRQPMTHENVTMVYNGEIYNFLAIRKELESVGYRFRSTTDSEVILKAFHHWGLDSVHRFIGMFAIALYDHLKEKLYLLRDRAGVKPLFYYRKNGAFLFASELKSFHRHPGFSSELSPEGTVLYLRYGYIPAPYTIFRGACKLRPGHYLEYDLRSGGVEEHRYWDVVSFYNKPRLALTMDEAEEELEKILLSAFTYRMVADVPVGVFLSGGYDSTAVAALLQANHPGKLKTFTIGFREQGYDEAVHARKVAQHLGTDHTEHYCTVKDALEIIPNLAEIYDEPFSDISAIPTILVSRLARQQVTVALSGDGGDETFCGYRKHFKYTALVMLLRKMPSFSAPLVGILMDTMTPLARFAGITNISHKKRFIRKFIRKVIVEDLDTVLHEQIAPHFSDWDTANSMVRRQYDHHIFDTAYHSFSRLKKHNDAIARMLAVDYQTYMVDDILQKVDRATMSVSLEGREPLLDHRTIEFAARLPTEMKYRGGVSKYLLRRIVHKYAPKEIMDRPKMGFGVPLNAWLKNELSFLIEDHLSEKSVKKYGVLRSENVNELIDRFNMGQAQDLLVWNILMLQMWAARWM